MKLITGVGLLAFLGAWDRPVAGWAFLAVAALHLLAGLLAPRRGLTGVLTGTHLASTLRPTRGSGPG